MRLLFFLFLSAACYGQSLDLKVMSDLGQFFYIGMESTVQIVGAESAQLECRNCDTIFAVGINMYKVKPRGNAKITEFTIRTNSQEKVVRIPNKHIPRPTIFFDDLEANGKKLIVPDGAVMSVQYPIETQIKSQFELLEWELLIPGEKSFKGKGNKLSSDAMEKVQSGFNRNKKAVLIYTCRNVNGFTFQAASEFIL